MIPTDPLAVVEDVRRASRAADGHDPVDEAAHLRLKHHGLADTRSWVEEGGFALRYQQGDHDVLDLAVDPSARGRGLGGRLAVAAAADPGTLTAWSHGDHPAARTLAERLGFERTRELWVMRRRSAVPLPAAEPPPGVTIRDFGTADTAALLAVNAAAFAGHPEQGGLTGSDLDERMAEPWFDPAGLLLAVDDDGSLLGFHWTKRHDETHGEVYVLAVSPSAHGRGIGRVLTVAGLHHLASRGLEEVVLYVEADNSAALGLYSGLRFTHVPTDTHVQYRRGSHEPQPSHETPRHG